MFLRSQQDPQPKLGQWSRWMDGISGLKKGVRQSCPAKRGRSFLVQVCMSSNTRVSFNESVKSKLKMSKSESSPFLDQFSEERPRGSNDVSLRTRWHVKAGWKSRMLRSKREKGTMDPSLDVSGWAASCERKADGEGCDNNQQMRQMMDSLTKEKGNMWY